MPRKKKIDHTLYETKKYWNQLLADYGLSIERGRHPKLVYVGDSYNVSVISDLESTKNQRPFLKSQNG